MNLYKNLTGLGYPPTPVNYRTAPKDPSRFISLEEINLANLSIKFKSVGIVPEGKDPVEVKAENSKVTSVAYGEGADASQFGADSIIATDRMILAHPSSLTSGDEQANELVNGVYHIVGETSLSQVNELTDKQASELTSMGFILLLDTNQL